MYSWPPKNPNEVLDYQLDWGHITQGDLIVTSTWSIEGNTGLQIHATGITGNTTVVWLTAGVQKTKYFIHNVIETINGEIHDKRISLYVKS